MTALRYLSGYSLDLRDRVQKLIDANKLGPWLAQRYPPEVQHLIQSDAVENVPDPFPGSFYHDRPYPRFGWHA